MLKLKENILHARPTTQYVGHCWPSRLAIGECSSSKQLHRAKEIMCARSVVTMGVHVGECPVHIQPANSPKSSRWWDVKWSEVVGSSIVGEVPVVSVGVCMENMP